MHIIDLVWASSIIEIGIDVQRILLLDCGRRGRTNQITRRNFECSVKLTCIPITPIVLLRNYSGVKCILPCRKWKVVLLRIRKNFENMISKFASVDVNLYWRIGR